MAAKIPALNNEIEEIYDDLDSGRIITSAAGIVAFIALAAVSQQVSATANRFPVLSTPPQVTAANVGLAWLEPQAGGPSRLRLIAENSTGSFEIVLLGVTT